MYHTVHDVKSKAVFQIKHRHKILNIKAEIDQHKTQHKVGYHDALC